MNTSSSDNGSPLDENTSNEIAGDEMTTPEKLIEAGVIEDSVPVPMPLGSRIKNSLAFGLSAVLSPYLVLPIGTTGIIGSITLQQRTFLFYTAISIFFSTILPALYVVNEVRRGKITDVHIMDRTQRGGPFLIAIVSSALGAWCLYAVGAPSNVWGISAALALNGIILTWITTFWKISMHVAVLSATVCAAIIMLRDVTAWPLLLTIPALIWGRVSRGRHTLAQGLAGAFLAALITGGALLGLRYAFNTEMRSSFLTLLGLN